MKYRHIIKPNIKNIYIKIDKDANVILTSSLKDSKKAKEFIRKKERWVKKAIQRQLQRPKRENVYKNGGVVYYLGKSYVLRFEKSQKRKGLIFDANEFVFYGDNPNRCKKEIDQFYRIKSFELLPGIVDRYSKKLSLYPKKLLFRKMKRRVGSCSYDNIITLNIKCMKLTLEEIEYVVVHELSHIKHKNHSKEFWKEVQKEIKEYKAIREMISI